MAGVSGQRRRGGLLGRVTCPHCWEHFAPEKILWISEHQDLLGDPRLGPEQPQRFLPTRFSVGGEAGIDAKGLPIASNWRVLIVTSPSAAPLLVMLEPLFLPDLRARPASGKSYGHTFWRP